MADYTSARCAPFCTVLLCHVHVWRLRWTESSHYLPTTPCGIIMYIRKSWSVNIMHKTFNQSKRSCMELYPITRHYLAIGHKLQPPPPSTRTKGAISPAFSFDACWGAGFCNPCRRPGALPAPGRSVRLFLMVQIKWISMVKNSQVSRIYLRDVKTEGRCRVWAANQTSSIKLAWHFISGNFARPRIEEMSNCW